MWLTRLALLLLSSALLLPAACSTEPSLPEADTAAEIMDLNEEIYESEVIIGQPCENLDDCKSSSDCLLSAQCLDGGCKYSYANSGHPCSEGCYIMGTCDGLGHCENLVPMECQEMDGNICTVPSCNPATSECEEVLIQDGKPPYISSECWEGAICMGGTQDNSDSVPTDLALECEELSEAVESFSCLDKYVCVGGREGCKKVFKVDSVECWTDDIGGNNETCQGHSCLAGQCVVDNTLDNECTQLDYPEECEGSCLTCTDLVCNWIPDPANPDNPTKKVRYCKPEAIVGFACTEDPCMLGQVCALGSQANGPLGKETLGKCDGGAGKSKEQCAEELGKPALSCILAGISCNSADGGCMMKQTISDQWCYPPEWKCFDKNDTYCTHLNTGETWDPETGCQTSWVNLNCDDSNDCTVDVCKTGNSEWKCEHQPVDGSTCDDLDNCTVNEKCVEGVCTDGSPKCLDDDENPCNDPYCDPFSGLCQPAQTDGYGCNDDNACTIGDTCQNMVCLSGQPKSCDDDNVCTDDFCHPSSGCIHDNISGVCTDGNASTVDDFCQEGVCIPGTPINCDDGNQCTDDIPDPVAGCLHQPIQGACSDDSVCTEGDSCAGGQCIPGPEIICEDNKYCTVDSCHPVTGCVYDPLPNDIPCPGGLNAICKNGVCLCIPNCAGKNCGDNGCGGSCGNCGAGDCVDGQCTNTGDDKSGTYGIAPAVWFSCFSGIVSISFSSVVLQDTGNQLFIQPTMNGCCQLTGDSAQDGSFTASCVCPSGGFGCNENYSLTGTFQTPTSWTGTFSASFNGMLCGDCTFYNTNITGTLQ